MAVQYVGPVSIKRFLDLLPRASMQAPKLDCGQVPESGGNGQGMHAPLNEAIKRSKCCPALDFCDTSGVADALTGLRPDGTMLRSRLCESAIFKEQKNYIWAAEVIFQLKPSVSDDPFNDQDNGPNANTNQAPLEMAAKESMDARGRLTDCATKVMSLQHRTFCYTVCIAGHRARIIRWDRAGAIVSASFDYVKTQSLGEFLWRYAHATHAERGFDETVSLATPQEDRTFTKAIMKHLETSPNSDYRAKVQVTLDRLYPTYKVRVVDSASQATAEYLVRRPFFTAPAFSDRATRGYIAWGVQEKDLRFLKDTWRTDAIDLPSETQVYQLLHNLGVPHLPDLCKAGDVGHDGKQQCTLTDAYAKHSFFWEQPTDPIRRRAHHRLVQKLALPLYMAESSLQLTKAIRNVLIVIERAFRNGELLHRDISAGNVMLNDLFEGILNDWDHVIQLSSTRDGYASRMGTWQFMSAALLQDPRKCHAITDDVESCFWLLLTFAWRYFGCTHRRLNLNLFDTKSVREDEEGKLQYYGGLEKEQFLSSRSYADVECECAPLKRVIVAFGNLLFSLYVFGNEHGRKLFPSHEHLYQDALKAVEEVKSVIKIFNDAIASDDWPRENDARRDFLQDQPPIQEPTPPADHHFELPTVPVLDSASPPLSLLCHAAFAKRLRLPRRVAPQIFAGLKRARENEESSPCCPGTKRARIGPEVAKGSTGGPVTRSKTRAQSQQVMRSQFGAQTRSMTRTSRSSTLASKYLV